MTLVCISLMISDEHLLMCLLAILISSLVFVFVFFQVYFIEVELIYNLVLISAI